MFFHPSRLAENLPACSVLTPHVNVCAPSDPIFQTESAITSQSGALWRSPWKGQTCLGGGCTDAERHAMWSSIWRHICIPAFSMQNRLHSLQQQQKTETVCVTRKSLDKGQSDAPFRGGYFSTVGAYLQFSGWAALSQRGLTLGRCRCWTCSPVASPASTATWVTTWRGRTFSPASTPPCQPGAAKSPPAEVSASESEAMEICWCQNKKSFFTFSNVKYRY